MPSRRRIWGHLTDAVGVGEEGRGRGDEGASRSPSGPFRTARWHRALAVLPMAAMGACSSATEPEEGASPLAGSWSYEGVQALPQSRELSGTVIWYSVSGGSGAFEGSFQLVEERPGEGFRTVSGIGSGMMLADTVADFEIQVDGVGRRHIGVLRRDSIKGNWVELRSDGASGTFLLRRES